MRIAVPLALLILLESAAAVAGSSPPMPSRGDDAERVSKNGKLTGKVDGVEVVVTYGRPTVQGRQVWGKLVPYGKVWRTGANEATVVAFDGDVKVEGKKLPAGVYALFTIPSKGKWKVIFNAQPKQWGAYKHDASKDVLKVDVSTEAGEHTEELTFTLEGNELVLHWEKLKVPVRIEKAG